MKTTGKWQKDISGSLFDADIRPEHADYGYRITTHTADVVQQILDKEAIHRAKGVRLIAAIGHSLGSFALGSAIRQHPGLQFQRVILWGCVLERDFPWSRVTAQIEEVLHEACPADPWPKLARRLPLFGGGDAGSTGFTDCGGIVREVHYDKSGHSNLGTALHCERTWVPFLLRGELPTGAALC
jgi:pimeloyl-ACP methyl ester carboxylesterase